MDDESPLELAIHDLASDSRLTPAWADTIRDAARVALDRNQHESPVAFGLRRRGRRERRGRVAWESATDTHRDNYQPKKATELAGECLSLAYMRAADDLRFVGRVEEGGGADFIVAPSPHDMERALVVEAHGCNDGDESVLTGRLRQKVNQIRDGSGRRRIIPAVAVVVGLRQRLILAQDVPLAGEGR